ncbi:MAG: hypothetical protein Q9191_005723 [Dirinaria sp. TL-2023a]
MASRTAFKRLMTTLWVLVFLEFVLTIATLGVTASAAQGFRQNLNYPRIPGKLAYNIAADSLPPFDRPLNLNALGKPLYNFGAPSQRSR